MVFVDCYLQLTDHYFRTSNPPTELFPIMEQLCWDHRDYSVCVRSTPDDLYDRDCIDGIYQLTHADIEKMSISQLWLKRLPTFDSYFIFFIFVVCCVLLDVSSSTFLNEKFLASFSFIFIFSIFNRRYAHYNILSMTRFEPQTSGIGSKHSANWTTADAPYH